MRIVRLIVDVAVPTGRGFDREITDDQILCAVEQACDSAENCIAAEVVEVKRMEVTNA